MIVAGAIFSITLNAFLFNLVNPMWRWVRARPGLAALLERPVGAIAELPGSFDAEKLRDHVAVVGSGRVEDPWRGSSGNTGFRT